jgi:hypothetical protein
MFCTRVQSNTFKYLSNKCKYLCMFVVLCIYTKLHVYILDIHQQNAQITNKVQSAPYHKQTLHMFQLSMSHHQGFFNSVFQGLIAPC